MAQPPRWDGRSPYDLYGSRRPPGPPPPPPRPRRGGRIVAGAVAIVLVGVLAVSGTRLFTFLRSVANIDNPLQLLPVEPPAGSVPYKLKHGQQVNILALGYGGAENDAPYPTDSNMGISIDPAHQRIVGTSIPPGPDRPVHRRHGGRPAPRQ